MAVLNATYSQALHPVPRVYLPLFTATTQAPTYMPFIIPWCSVQAIHSLNSHSEGRSQPWMQVVVVVVSVGGNSLKWRQ
ncbi:hypothetical protein Pmani_022177 [Petrolisthes manimaculis]|uniref:Uncharacterized protein n=1 Tax=Petrolisthes manimaculis TaxID=1843537 RepID=A0AAE1PCA5_9EUCA|nr:hypothetical protein Pmani_022177 [Petrolisthes manimaculis]